MYLNNNEDKVIKHFIRNVELGKNYRLEFKDGIQFIGKYIDCYESCNCVEYSEEDEQFEEFYCFLFIIQKVEKKNNNKNIRKNKYFEFNYHNFPTKWELVDI